MKKALIFLSLASACVAADLTGVFHSKAPKDPRTDEASLLTFIVRNKNNTTNQTMLDYSATNIVIAIVSGHKPVVEGSNKNWYITFK